MNSPKPSSPKLSGTIETPKVEYAPELPISAYRQELIDLIHNHQVIIVCGETGSGKSTQLPKFCLEAGLGQQGVIGHTQPRRLAARSIASRLAEELECKLGELVGYQIRFGDQTSEGTRIKLMTDGILLAETQSDRNLRQYEAIIIDEAHERSLNIDFLLGYLRNLQSKRPDLKIIITSATIDAERFAEHFADDHGPAPIIQVEGRGYPVEIQYLPWEEVFDETDQGESRRYDIARHVVAGIDQLSRVGNGDTLIFLPTERDIREVSHRVAGHFKRRGQRDRVDLLPLYARLPSAEQQRIFHPDGSKQRFIFATNVAESSLTVPGIRYVIDTGTARISRYSARSKVQRLPVEEISRASADQRAGRCGRIGPGVCLRLYSQDEFDHRDAFTTPEIRRTNLAAVVLRTKTLRLGRLEDFPLLDPPRQEAIREGIQTLIELGALDEQQELTDTGWQLGRLPVDPRVGRILIEADRNGALPEVLPIAAALEIQDPRDRPPDRQQAADEAHTEFADPRSDFLSLLRLWRFYEEARSQNSRTQLNRLLRKKFLSPARMREWTDIYRQLREMSLTSLQSRRSKKKPRRTIGKIRYSEDTDNIVDETHYETIHQSLLSGLLFGVATVSDKHEYTGARGLKLFLWPGSGIFGAKPKWVMAAELIETSKPFARTVARIDHRWIEKIAGHLLKRSHSDPHWSNKANGAFCYENATLYGLPVVVRRRVPLPPIDPATSRDLLIEQGLVEQNLKTTAKFIRHNRALRQAFQELANRTRRRQWVIDDYALSHFYQSRLPADVVDRSRLEKLDRTLQTPDSEYRISSFDALAKWAQSPAANESTGSLYLHPSDLIDTVNDSVQPDDFPTQIEVGQSRLPLEYHFEPGSESDGIRLKVHPSALPQISDDRLGWFVPGLLHEKLVALIKSLPKRIRRNLVPAADVAEQIRLELLEVYGQVPFMNAVCEVMSRLAEMPVNPTDFQQDKLAHHLDFLVTIVDDEGETLAESRQVEQLRSRFTEVTTSTKTTVAADVDNEAWSLDHAKTFSIKQLPVEVVRQRGGVQVAQYPGMIDHGDSVSTQLFPDQKSAEASIRRGLTRLYAINESKELRSQVRWLPALDQAKVKLTGWLPVKNLETSLADLLARIAFIDNEPLARDELEFEARRKDRGRRIAGATQVIASWLDNLAEHGFLLRRELESVNGSARHELLIKEIKTQLDWLLFDGFLQAVPWQWLQHYPRYLHAIAYRMDKSRGAGSRDRELSETVFQLWNQWLEQLPESTREPNQQVDSEFRWMIEELRVSLFAQPLGTAVKVSPQRCAKLIK
ncbi:MAG: ATP-dependent RNA helicase HrpA [Planctomycetota bacterium]